MISENNGRVIVTLSKELIGHLEGLCEMTGLTKTDIVEQLLEMHLPRTNPSWIDEPTEEVVKREQK